MIKNNFIDTIPSYKVIDLFAGIGGIRIGFDKAFQNNTDVVFSSEIDKFAQTTYTANFNHQPHGDITKIEAEDIPNFDILLGGFPCQPFSNAGLKKGFDDTRGTLFFDSGMYQGNVRPYSQWRATTGFWHSLITDSH